MKFGVCGDPKTAAAAARAGYDYAEWSVPSLLNPLESDEVFESSREVLRAAGVPYEVANGFVPGRLKITGAEVDYGALEGYVSTAMRRAEELGVDVIVFGSGGARRIPEGFDAGRAWEQLVTFSGMAAALAHKHGVTIAVEPLNLAECNVLNTVGECARLVREVAHPGIRLLVDAYHLMRDGDALEDILRNADILAHMHIATEANRQAPGTEPCDFGPFFQALAEAGYTGRLSIEGGIQDADNQLPVALEVMRGCCRRAETAAGQK